MPNALIIPEAAQCVTLLAPAADAAGRTSTSAVTLKNCHMAYLVYILNQGNAATILLTPQQASAVAKTGAKALTNVVPVWSNQDEATNSTLVRGADAVNFTTSAAVTIKRVIFQIDPTKLDVAGGFDCLLCITGASNAANITSAEVWTVPLRHGGLAAPSLLTD